MSPKKSKGGVDHQGRRHHYHGKRSQARYDAGSNIIKSLFSFGGGDPRSAANEATARGASGKGGHRNRSYMLSSALDNLDNVDCNYYRGQKVMLWLLVRDNVFGSDCFDPDFFCDLFGINSELFVEHTMDWFRDLLREVDRRHLAETTNSCFYDAMEGLEEVSCFDEFVDLYHTRCLESVLTDAVETDKIFKNYSVQRTLDYVDMLV